MEEDLIYIPGCYVCMKCDFHLSKMWLSLDGRVSTNPTEAMERCPNDYEVMRRETWKDRVDSQEKMIVDLLAQLRQVQPGQ